MLESLVEINVNTELPQYGKKVARVLPARDSVSCMQTSVCEEFMGLPLACAICQKPRKNNGFAALNRNYSQSFPQEVWKLVNEVFLPGSLDFSL